MCVYAVNCALYWRPVTLNIQIQRLSHGVMCLHIVLHDEKSKKLELEYNGDASILQQI